MTRPNFALSAAMAKYLATMGTLEAAETVKPDIRYRFTPHFHPYASELAELLASGGLAGLQRADTLNKDGGVVLAGAESAHFYEKFFDQYSPNPELVLEPHPVKELDFEFGGAYSVYNWELFYHVPLTCAIHLSRNGRHEAAQKWLHFIFDPTEGTDPGTTGTKRYWKVKPFQINDVERIEAILAALDVVGSGATPTETAAAERLFLAVEAWREDPFRPHVVASYRPTAYMWKALFVYLDNLCAWGDSLFRQDTRESINEAMQLYVFAANILGPRPQDVPAIKEPVAQTYAQLRGKLGAMQNARVEAETLLPFARLATGDSSAAAAASADAGTAPYFCVPGNPRLLEYWDKVTDRLFKIRNSLDIRGVFRQLPLFPPPIDPGLLAAAAAAGLDPSAVIAGINQPLPILRFGVLIQRATDLAGEVRALGASVLSAIEKHDAEALAVLRSAHESTILELGKAARYAQWKEAEKAREGVDQTLKNAIARFSYFERLLGTDVEEPSLLDDLEFDGLLDGRYRSVEPTIDSRDVEVDIASPIGVLEGLAGAGELHLSPSEAWALRIRTLAEVPILAADVLAATSAGVSAVPDVTTNAHYWGIGVQINVSGGQKISSGMNSLVGLARAIGDAANRQAGRMDTAAGFARREQEWAFQSATVANEIKQIYKQLRASQLREFVAIREYETHLRQMKNAAELEEFLSDERNGKTTNEAFYAWMRREVQGLHSQAYQLAFDVAKKAERCLQHELGDQSRRHLRYDYAAGKQGLLAGDKLMLDIKRMQVDYDDRNEREYELGPALSLKELNARELLRLRKTGSCTFEIPEWFLDLHTPGTYFRRIKSVALSLPSVTGQFTSVNCRLTLVDSRIRTQASGGAEYGELLDPLGSDDRFNYHFGSTQSVITSTAVNDSGLFETNLRDERYLPFEGSGAISTWRLELPGDPRDNGIATFDYESIADAILHIRYTAREGGQQLAAAATGHVAEFVKSRGGLIRVLSLAESFPQASQALATSQGGPVELSLPIDASFFPKWMRTKGGPLEKVPWSVEVYLPEKATTIAEPGAADPLDGTFDPALAANRFELSTKVGVPSQLAFGVEGATRGDGWLVLTRQATVT